MAFNKLVWFAAVLFVVCLVQEALSCTTSECRKACKSLGHSTGGCVGFDCYCRSAGFLAKYETESSDIDKKEKESELADASDIKSEGQNEKVEPEKEKIKLFDVIKSDALKLKGESGAPYACLNSSCNYVCRALGYLWGQCIGGDCWCYY